MKLLKGNETITLSGQEAIALLRETEYLLISLRDIARHYYEGVQGDIGPQQRASYCEATTAFIDDNQVTHRLASLRTTISAKFNLELGSDDMDDIERALQDITYWKPR